MDFMRFAAAAAFLTLYTVQAASDGGSGGSCYEYNIDYNGYDILTLTGVESPSLCQDACAQTYKCIFWSWSTNDKNCYLKSKKAMLGRQEAENIISGPKTCLTRHGCYSEGVDYVGYDLHRIEGQTITSPQACQQICLQEPQCAFFSYKITTQNCYLKHGGAIGGRSIDPDVVSGPRVCPDNNNNNNINNNNINYNNYNNNNHNNNHINNDNNHHNNHHNKHHHKNQYNSNHIDINKIENTLNNNTTNKTTTNNENIIKNTNNTAALPEHYCAEGSTEYRGRDIDIKKNIRSASHCQQLCFIHTKCFFWTWDKTKFTCSLKDDDAVENKAAGRHTIGKVSGAKECLPINTGCHLLNTGFLGTVIKQIKSSATFESCQLNCQNDLNCKYFTWSLNTQICQLRGDTPFGYIRDSSTQGMVAGPKFCPNDDICMEQADYVGFDLESIEDGSVLSAIECRSICRQTEGCAFWTWVQNAKNCYLKTEEALVGKRNGLNTIGRYSGPTYCNLRYDCLEPNVAYLSATATRSRNLSTYTDCDNKCKNTTGCIRWTYLAESRTCLLLAATDRAEKIQYDGALSSSVDCSNQQKKGNAQKCLFPGVKFKDSPLSHVTHASSTDDCHFECMNKEHCRVFTFENGTGCTLYNKPLSELIPWPTAFPVAVSGTSDCAQGVVSTEEGALNNTCYTTNAIDGGFFYAYNPGECADACVGVPGCMYWTYDPKKRADSCTLFKSGALADSKCTGSVSAAKTKQAGTYDTYRYEATGTVIDDVVSLDKCREECAMQGYAFWTYYPKKKQCKLHEDGNYVKVRDFFAACGTVEDPLSVFNANSTR